jgi:hypothetical protein
MELNLQEFYIQEAELYETRNGKLFEVIYKDEDTVITLSYPIEFTDDENTKLYPRVIGRDYFDKEYNQVKLPENFDTISFKQKKLAIQLVIKQLEMVSDISRDGLNEQ